MSIKRFRFLLQALATLVFFLAWATPGHAANCYMATSQGTSGPANWQTYCWIDFTTYNDTSARSGSGQNYSLVLQDGTTLNFNMKVSGAAITSATSPSWSGASIGNSSFLGIGGKPVMYQTAAGTTTITISSITLTPPSGTSAVTAYMFVAGDAESSNDGETLKFQTNGGNWVQLDQSGPISGSVYPTASGLGTSTYTITGVAGTVGAYIVGSSTPTTLTTTLVGGGLQGAMFAVRFSSIQLNTQIIGARAASADQFTFSINATSGGSTLAAGTSSGTGLGPFTAAALSTTAAIPLTLTQTMAAGSTNSLSHYRSQLTCTNSASGSSTVMPTAVTTTAYSFGAMQFGDIVSCTYRETPFPHLTLGKALGGTGGRRYAGDQFVMNLMQGTTVVATTTTSGTTTTITNGTTPQYQAAVGTTYTFSESGAGVTSLNEYNATMSCTNAYTGSSTTLPTTVGGAITPAMGDVVTCTITNTRKTASARLSIVKASEPVSDPVNGTVNPKMIPGAIVRYTFTVSNTGPNPVDNNTVWLIDTLPSQMRVGTAASPTFTQGSPTSGLTFTAATDIRYSNATSAPTSFAGCTYTPVAAYDPAVRFICLNPKGTMAASTGTPPNFSLSVNAQLN